MSHQSVICVCFFALAALSAQDSRKGVLVASGYRIPTNLVTGSPGHLSVISISGIAPILGVPIASVPDSNGYPSELGGIRIRIAPQSGQATEARIIGLQQSGCPVTATNCAPVTSVTYILPEDLPLTLIGRMVTDGMTTVAEIPFRAVSDNLHFLTSCDATLIWVGIFFDAANTSQCLPNVIQNSMLVNTSPTFAVRGCWCG